MNPTQTPPQPARPPGVNLFMRTDGSLMIVKGDAAIEIALTVDQLLMLGMDCLSVAMKIKPDCAAEVERALSSTQVLVPVEAAQVAPKAAPQEGPACLH